MPPKAKDTIASNRLAARFTKEPTIENYVALRRKFPTARIALPVTAGRHASLFSESKLKNISDDARKLWPRVLDGDEGAIDKLCFQLMEKLIERRQLERVGPDTFLDYLLVIILEAVERHGLRVTPALLVLLRDRLGGINSRHRKAHEKYENQISVIYAAADLISNGQTPSLRTVAKELGVNQTTVRLWLRDSDRPLLANAQCLTNAQLWASITLKSCTRK